MKRWRMSIMGAVAAAALVVGGGGLAHADSIVVDGDAIEVESGAQSIDFGNVACGATTPSMVDLSVKRNGSTNSNVVFKDSAAVTFSVVSSTGSGIDVEAPTPASVTLPSNWTTLGNNVESSTVEFEITVGSSVEGLHTGSVTFRASGTNTRNVTHQSDATVNIRFTVLPCESGPSDTTAPVVQLTCPTEPITQGHEAFAEWSATDESGGTGLATSPANGQILLDTSVLGVHTFTLDEGWAKDVAGNSSAAVECDYEVVDRTPPVVMLTCPTQPVLLGSVATASWTAADEPNGSGLATPASGTIELDTSSIGSKTATAPEGTAVDNAGNPSEAKTCPYSVIYDFTGFFRPVDMGGVVNSVKAGSGVPMKFSLAGDQGLDILAAGSPKVVLTSCAAGATVDPIEQLADTAGGSKLSYDSAADQYVYVWKTEKAWAGQCGTFKMTLADGQVVTALFKFLK